MSVLHSVRHHRGRIAVATLAAAILGVLWATIGDSVQAQVRCRVHVPAIGRPINPGNLPPVLTFDPCSNRLTMTDDALKPTGGPFITRGRAEEALLARGRNPAKLRSYFTTYGEARRLIGDEGDAVDVYPDRQVWLVVAKGSASDGPQPSIPVGVPTPDPRDHKYSFVILDATDGRALVIGARGGPTEPDWPARLPPDTAEDLARDAARSRAAADPARPRANPPPPIVMTRTAEARLGG